MKSDDVFDIIDGKAVTSYAEVWIEIPVIFIALVFKYVTSYAEVWIEI